MNTTTRLRYALLITLLLIAGGATIWLTMRPSAPPPAPPTPLAAATTVPMRTYLMDVAGWYEITPNETAVASPFDLTIDGLKTLPPTLGRWNGEPVHLGEAVDLWFENPDLALSNLYHDDQGHQAWLSIFGSRGRKSYFLFEHTPITSYPAAGWTIVENGVTPVPIGASRVYVQKTTLSYQAERRIVFYWYLWSDFQRDPEQGVLALRLHVPVISTDQDAFDAGADLLRALLPQVISWRRF